MWLCFSLRVLLLILRKEPAARIQTPPPEYFELFVNLIAARYSNLGRKRVAVAIDGVKFDVCKPGTNEKQSVFYNGWTHGHYISNVFVFAPNGTIVAMVINAPGALHDSTLMEMGKLYDKMETWANDHSVRMVVDSAFQCIDRPYFIRSSQDVAVICDNDDPGEYAVLADATSARQYAEWGMRGFRSSFPRINDRIRFEERGERMLMMQCLPRLYNLRCNFVGINQIRNYFLPALLKKAEDFNDTL